MAGPVLLNGKITRASFDPARRPDDDSGWYVGHDFVDLQVIVWGDWRTGQKDTWTSKSVKSSPKLRQKVQEAREVAVARAEAAKEVAVAERAETAFGIWQNAEPDQPHEYLERKAIGPEQLRVDARGSLIVPMRAGDGILKNIQRIAPDGVKKFFGPSTGLSWQAPLLPADGDLILCEGVATGGTLRKLTGLTVWAALTAGNMSKVGAQMRARFPGRRILVAADNDRLEKTGAERAPEKNVGLVAATTAAREIGGFVLAPEFPMGSTGTDWNDLAAEIGATSVVEAWSRGVMAAALDARLARMSPAKFDAQAGHLLEAYNAAGIKINQQALRRRWKEMAGGVNTEAAAAPVDDADEEQTYYDIGRQQFLQVDDRGVWMSFSQAQATVRMRAKGVADTEETPLALSTWLSKTQDSRGVDYSGPIAGYPSGMVHEGKSRYLVTVGPELVVPKEGGFPLIATILAGVLDAEGIEQSEFLNGWLSVSVRALYAGLRQPGQCVVLVGPRNCGKSLIQDIITQVLGGRSAKPYRYMAGLTTFNGDLVGAEHLQMGDETPHTDAHTRREFGAQIKQICVESVQRIEDKYCAARVMRPFWRLSLSLNDEPENLRTLPMLDEHMVDKLMIFKAVAAAMPMPSATAEERASFWAALLAELPAFVYFLLHDFQIRPAIACQRFGITKFLHPMILADTMQHEPFMALLDCMDLAWFGGGEGLFPVEGTSQELEKRLIDSSYIGFEAKRLLSWRGAMGRYLGQLAREFPGRVELKRTSRQNLWVVYPGELGAE